MPRTGQIKTTVLLQRLLPLSPAKQLPLKSSLVVMPEADSGTPAKKLKENAEELRNLGQS